MLKITVDEHVADVQIKGDSRQVVDELLCGINAAYGILAKLNQETENNIGDYARKRITEAVNDGSLFEIVTEGTTGGGISFYY